MLDGVFRRSLSGSRIPTEKPRLSPQHEVFYFLRLPFVLQAQMFGRAEDGV